ncbi:hypothetical protein G5C51_34080 [Streptomyces sp. A7024]|uniref:Uncharacterized protein n=1 Tax=Streptomyces coryli TaxID=1128680 RepID=A0A6G4UB17_9ACTN|nr:hypothetical protein [Streptomyces coryli]NGN68910.1 hypothetical protein [Streptomyces coryli]
MTVTVTFTDQDKLTLRTAAYGAVGLMSAPGVAEKPHKAATQGSIALTSATGAIGHVLGAPTGGMDLGGKNIAELADRVLPALTESMALLKKQDPAEAGNFLTTVLVAVEAAVRTNKRGPGPATTEMVRKITEALNAA